MTNYSFETSYPPYVENMAFNKKRQCDEILAIIKKGANNLLQIADVSGIPQAIVSARVNNLIEETKVKYEGFTYAYKNRKRKKIVVIKQVLKGTQKELFQ